MRGQVAVYYIALRAVLRNKPHLRRHLVRCRYCWIFFLTDPRNAGREDLGCPFGCRDHHRRRNSTKRSVAHNASAVGKIKKYQRMLARKLAAARAAAEATEPQEARCAASLGGAQEAGAPSVDEIPPGPREDLPAPSREPLPPLSDSSATIAEPPLPAADVRSTEVRGPDASRELTPYAGEGLPRAETGGGEYGAGILRYVRTVVSLIEARRVSAREVLEMLERQKRQHSLARERRIDKAVRRLRGEWDKPP